MASAERHAELVLALAGVVSGAIVGLVVMRDVSGSGDWFEPAIIALTIAMFLLVYRLSSRTVRAAAGSARRHMRLSQSMMGAAQAFAHEPAGMRGSVEALCRTARESGCEALIWDDAQRTLWSPLSGERHVLPVAATHRLAATLQTRGPLQVPDLSVFSTLPTALTQRNGSNALVVAPMWHGIELLGIVFKRYGSSRRMRRADESGMVGALAAIGAVALGKALVVEREHQNAQHTSLLLRSVQTANDRTQQDYLLHAARQAAEAVGAERSGVYAMVRGQLRLVGAHGIARTASSEARGISERSPLADRCRRIPEQLHPISLATTEPETARVLRDAGFGPHVLVRPVHDGGDLTGLLVLECEESAISGPLAALIGGLADQLAVALDRQRMWRSSRRRSRHLACMPKLARSLTGQRDPAAVARITARELHDGFGFGRVSIALADPDDRPALVASSGMLAQSSMALVSTAVFDHVFQTGQAYVCVRGESTTLAEELRPQDPNAPAGSRSQIVVPVIGADHRCVGAVAVYERDPDALGEDDLHTLETVADQLAGTLEQASLFETLERSYFKTVEALAAALEAKDAYTLSHAQSITETSAAVGRRLGMREPEVRDLKLGALLHDIGKIGVPGDILNKNGPLTDAEYEIMKQHTVIGEQIIAPIEFLEGVRPLVLHEHERWDGMGYPHGLRGNDIPMGARIIFVCDAYHAMTSDRPYRQSLPEVEAQRRLRQGAGTQFDPHVVEAFLEVLEIERQEALVDHVSVPSSATAAAQAVPASRITGSASAKQPGAKSGGAAPVTGPMPKIVARTDEPKAPHSTL